MAPKFSRSCGKFQGDTGQKNLVKRVKLRVFGHFLENAWGKGLNPDHLIKSSRYTGGDFIFLYRFVRRRRRPQILVHAITFEQLLRFLSFFDDCWPWPIDYLIRFWSILVVTLSNMEFAISQPKMVRLPRNEKQTHLLNSRPQMWPSGLTLTMTMTLTFQGQIWNLLYLSQKWCDCHKTNSKHIDWCQGLKCDHRVWPWPWPWPWIFKVKCGICYISAKNGPIATKRKANITIEPWDSNVTIRFDLGHHLDLEFSR